MKYSFDSERLGNFCNAAMSVVTDGAQFEKIVLFGGLLNSVKSEEELAESLTDADKTLGITPSRVSSFLTNKTYLISVNQRQIKSLAVQQKGEKKYDNPAKNYLKSLAATK